MTSEQPPAKSRTHAITVRLNEEDWRRLRVSAAERGVSMGRFLVMLWTEWDLGHRVRGPKR
jgi:hypothetical protein